PAAALCRTSARFTISVALRHHRAERENFQPVLTSCVSDRPIQSTRCRPWMGLQWICIRNHALDLANIMSPVHCLRAIACEVDMLIFRQLFDQESSTYTYLLGDRDS